MGYNLVVIIRIKSLTFMRVKEGKIRVHKGQGLINRVISITRGIILLIGSSNLKWTRINPLHPFKKIYVTLKVNLNQIINQIINKVLLNNYNPILNLINNSINRINKINNTINKINKVNTIINNNNNVNKELSPITLVSLLKT